MKKLLFVAPLLFLFVSAVFADSFAPVPASNGQSPSRLFMLVFGLLLFFVLHELRFLRKLNEFRIK